jgi:hypothetical protein
MYKSRISLILLALVGVMLLGACQKEPFRNGEEFLYSTFAIGTEGSHQIVLDNLFGEIKSISCKESWLTASDGGQSANGHPIVVITNKDGAGAEGTITVTDENGNIAVITVQHQPLDDGDAVSGSNDDFMQNWWNFVNIPLEGFDVPQKAPWTAEGSANIPEYVSAQYLPGDGWEMAFSYVNNPTMKGVRSFGLYNRWTGLLRVFSYIDDPTGWGNELLFRTYFGTSSDDVMYPFYHAMAYGIPTNHVPGVTLLRNAQIVADQDQTFMDWVGPYQKSQSLQRGWYAFDYDLSGFVPAGKDWLKGRGARMTFLADTKETSTISLRGSLTGKIDGEFENPQDIQRGGTSFLRKLGAWAGIGSAAMSSSIAGSASYAKALEAQNAVEDFHFLQPAPGAPDPGPNVSQCLKQMDLTKWKMVGGMVCSFASVGFNILSEWVDPISYEHEPGTINLNLDTSIELDGYLVKTTPNGFSPLAVSAQAIETANGPEGHLGNGIWGLAEDPVVYIDKDVILSSAATVNLVSKGNNTYANPNAPQTGLRMVWFFDPTSVKVNLNTADFPGVEKVSVVATCGVYTDRTKGNTKAYRDMLMLETPSVDISGGKNLVRLNTTSSSPRLALVKPERLVFDDPEIFESVEYCELVKQPTSSEGEPAFYFYGRKVHMGGQDIMADPQIFLPFAQKDNSYIMECLTTPDFVVAVHIIFETSDGMSFHFSKCFVPRVEFVDHTTANEKVMNIFDYACKCGLKESTGTLANDPSVPVYNPDGFPLVGKTLEMYYLIN